MKKLFYTLCLLLSACMVLAQSTDKNYVKTKIYKVPHTGEQATDAPLTLNDTIVTVQYLNGLGQPIQSVAVAAGGDRQDIVSPVVYDGWGRQTRGYLPYSNASQTTPSLNYRDPETLITDINQYYQTKFPGELSATDPNPYAETLEEASPLNRVLRSGAPGAAWKINTEANDHSLKVEYLTNEFREVLNFKVNFLEVDGVISTDTTALACIGYYAPGKLYKTVTKNENWVDNNSEDDHDNTVEEFKDFEGRLILKRTYNNNEPHDTYYIYDKFGNLTYVIPPLAADEMVHEYSVENAAGKSFSWTKLVLVDQQLADNYERDLRDYDNPSVLSADLLNTYGATGGFSLVPDTNGNLVLSINIDTDEAMRLKTGNIVKLDEIGNFKDAELGVLEGNDYKYIFSIRDNSLFVTGDSGPVPSVNVSLNGNTRLAYSKNYFWPNLLKLDPVEAQDFNTAVSNTAEDELLITYIPNQYGALGGATISLDEDDNVTFSINITANDSVSLLDGGVIRLDIQRRITDRPLGSVAVGDGEYKFLIKDNSLVIEGSGLFTQLNFTTVRPPVTYEINEEALEGLGYIYHYDHRNRMVEKHIPDKGWTQIIYDKLNRPVLTQDENLRIKGKYNWLFTKYDVYGRIAYTGFATDLRKRRIIQNTLNAVVNPVLYESRKTSPFVSNGGNIHYSSVAFPNSTLAVNTVSYYEDYNFDLGGISTVAANVYGEQTTTNLTGLPTGSKVLVDGSTTWITTVTQYDLKARAVYTQTRNAYLSTIDITESDIDAFTGEVKFSKRTHTRSSTTTTVEDKFTYDHAGRMLTQQERVNSATIWEMITYNKYDEMGQLKEKKVGGTISTSYAATAGLQTVNYSYNIRGWLKGINDTDSSMATGTDLFAFKINYNTTQFSGATPLYNGNIAETAWRCKTDNKLRGYKYSYDALNRLTDANYATPHALVQYPAYNENYTEGAIEYDKQGNILHLERYGFSINKIDKIDLLSYTYQPYSNKLLGVSDAATTNGFNNGSTGANNDYEYDLNGNLTKDNNKAITGITYNYLDLPTKVTKSTTQNISYVYDATGTKLQKKVLSGLVTTTTDYAGGFVYQNNVMQYYPHGEGYVKRETSGTFTYVYQYKDHLGNVRLSYFKNTSTNALEVLEEENYYAFGMKHTGYNSVVSSNANSLAQKIEFNGKELQDELGLNWYDYGARNYDPTVGRWFNIDPLAEMYKRWSTYNYCIDNPVYFVDPDGMSSTTYTGDAAVAFVMQLQGKMNEAESRGGWVNIDGNIVLPTNLAAWCTANIVAAVSGGGGGAASQWMVTSYILSNGSGNQLDELVINATKDKSLLLSLGEGFLGGAEATLDWLGSQFTWKGYGESLLNTYTFGAYGTYQIYSSLATVASNIPNYTGNDYAYATGFIAEKVVEAIVFKKISAALSTGTVVEPVIEAELENVATQGGRLGNTATRTQIGEIATELEKRGYTITGGGGVFPEEYLKPISGGRSGGSYLDITATHPEYGTLRINTVDVLKDGVTPTAREMRNATRIRGQIAPGEHLLLIPKKP